MNTEIIRSVKEYMLSKSEEIVRDLFRLVRIPSVRGDAEEGAPFGRACRAALDEAVELFRENGFEASVSNDFTYALASYGDGSPTLALFGHTDVVPVGDDWELTSPFQPIRIGDCLVGRGVEDNKAGVIHALYVFKAFRDLNLPLSGRLLAFLGSAEETGMEDIESFCKNEPMPELSIVPDNEYPICLGEKGILHTMIESNEALSDVTAFEGGRAFNVVLDSCRARLGYTPERLDELRLALVGRNDVSLAREGEEIVLASKGLTSHACVPDGSINAALLLADLFASQKTLANGDAKIFKTLADLLRTVHGEAFGISCEDPYFGKVTSANGIVSVCDGHLRASFDIRYGSSSDGKEIERRVRETVCKSGFSVLSLSNDEGFRVDENAPASKGMLEVYRLLSGEEVKPFYSGGGTYARHLKNAYSIGVAVPYIPKEMTFSPGHGEIHQSDESFSLRALLESCSVAALMVCACELAFLEKGD
ncbi:MAG: Sapep family Mn(2+)-dependent dipeptidase [Clostridia bacterium]|nr:Sapep family Mn(2+)-dependent dipeptidase [Clostridia bacterium]